jgi:hypothetical protein
VKRCPKEAKAGKNEFLIARDSKEACRAFSSGALTCIARRVRLVYFDSDFAGLRIGKTVIIPSGPHLGRSAHSTNPNLR